MNDPRWASIDAFAESNRDNILRDISRLCAVPSVEGTPEPGGVSFDALRRALTSACSSLRVVAADVNELSPHYDQSGASTAVACKIVREILIAL